MNIEQVGSFRTRTQGDGSLEVWARGWRLESPLYALIPVGLALMFLLAPMPLPMRAGGAIVMLGAGLFVFRLQKPGLLFAEDAVTVVGVVRTRRYPWEGVSGFMGERRHDEGRVLLVLEGDERVPLPGTLDPSELDPYGEEGEMLSAVDQLNRLGERARAGQLPKPVQPMPGTPKRARPERPKRIAVPKLRRSAAVPDAEVPAEPEPSRGAALMERPEPKRSVASRPIVIRAPEPLEDLGPMTRKQARAERRDLRKALKAVKLDRNGVPIVSTPTASEPMAPEPPASTKSGGMLRRRRRGEPLTEVPIAEPAGPVAPTRAAPRPALGEAPKEQGRPSYYPTPTYIPQEEYARMLREQRAAEKAAVAAAEELRELADPELAVDDLGLTS
jgi:hypothetical protein